jgi:hypothetical protein
MTENTKAALSGDTRWGGFVVVENGLFETWEV